MKQRVGRPRDADKAAAVLDAGWSLFLEHGVAATPVQAIAAKAGVSKVTLYSHYPDKTALFRAAVTREMDRIKAQPDAAIPPAAPVADQLRGFGLGLLAFLASPPAIAFYSAIAGELRQHRDLARAFYDLGPGHTRAHLAGVIRAASLAGELAPCDPEQAAEDLFGLWQGFSTMQLLLEIDAATLRATIPDRVERGVSRFMQLYGP